MFLGLKPTVIDFYGFGIALINNLLMNSVITFELEDS